MNVRNLTPEEQYDLIIKCRTSGLTDHQWLEEKGISQSTFYSWISKFKSQGAADDIPKPLRRTSPHRIQPQEVVKLNVMPDVTGRMEQNTPFRTEFTCIGPVMEIISGHTRRTKTEMICLYIS